MQQFGSFRAIYQAVQIHPEFNDQIKLKRLKKQFELLGHYHNKDTSVEKIQLSSIGIELLIMNRRQDHNYLYKMILNFEYPFKRPQIHFLKKDHNLAKSKDLLDNLLENSKWGPALVVTSLLDKMSILSTLIDSSNVNDIKWSYELFDAYRRSYLKQMHIQTYNIEEYNWKYLMKSTRKKVLGLTNEVFFVFQEQTNNKENFILVFWKPINELTTAKATMKGKKFDLEITYSQNQKQSKMYFGGTGDVEQILTYLNPIEMIERNIQKFQKQPNIKIQDNGTQIVKQYTQLIEFYSLKDQVKAERYIIKMKEIIGKICSTQIKIQPQQEQMKQKQQQSNQRNHHQQRHEIET